MTFLPDAAHPARGHVVVYDAHSDGRALQDALVQWGFRGAHSGEVRVAVASEDAQGRAARVRTIPGCLVPLEAAVDPLLAVPLDGPAWRQPPDSVRLWGLAAHFALRLLDAQLLVPALVRDSDGGVRAVWRVALAEAPEARAAAARLATAFPPAAHAVALSDGERVWRADALLHAFFDAMADLAVRSGGAPPSGGRPRARLLPWTARWAEALTDPDDNRVPLRDDAEEIVAGVTGWLSGAAADTSVATTQLRLVPPDDPLGRWELSFGLRTHDAALHPAAEVWHPPDSAQDGDSAALQDALLAGLGRCARVFAPIDAALSEPAPTRVFLDLDQAWEFVAEAAPLLTGAGVAVVLPHQLLDSSVRLRARVDVNGEPDSLLEAGGAHLRWELAIGEDPLSDEEFDALTRSSAPLVRWRDQWVRVDPEDMEWVREVRARGLGEVSLPLAQALGMGLAGAWPADDLLPVARVERAQVDVVTGDRLAALVDGIRGAGERITVEERPPGFAGELRPYQRRGVAWLRGMAELGLGGILADQMGLGKTIQLIAHLLAWPDAARRRFLVVCPTSVLGNWEREIARFAPDLPVVRYHGTQRPLTLDEVQGVVVTTYGTLRRDVDALAAHQWDVVALDEAQFVKNPATAGARAVRRLRAQQIVALTGTPLENRLGELWALLDVTNRGLLGPASSFTRRFVVPIEQRRDAHAAARLRRLVAPFMLRRTKDDPAIVEDLPPKIERTVVCGLTPEQARLYEQAVEQALGAGLQDATAMQRRGRILGLLTDLKQICNHPAQYLREYDGDEASGGDEGFAKQLLGRSGKLATAREVVAEAVAAGEQLLVFTQYVAMGRLLVAVLSSDLDTPVPFLHGGVAAAQRDRMVARFQGDDDDGVRPPVLVVSLRAGGTGLNLTAATHVLHYDRWWNPAVEDQATDRAHRIGQTRPVEVHKLVTAGTVEERVADLLERKRGLADAVVGAGETWITELGDEELEALVALSSDADIAELDEEPGWEAVG